MRRKYEVLNGVRLADGTLRTDGVVTLDDKDDDTRKFLDYGAIRTVPGQDEPEEPTAHVAPVGQPEPAPPVETRGLIDTFGDDLANVLLAGGYTTVEAVRAAPDEELLSVGSIGNQRLRQIRKHQQNRP